MNKLKSSLTNMLVVLTVITIVAAGVLASVNAVTAPQIEKINAENLAAGIKAVMGSNDITVSDPLEVDPYTVYDVSDNQGTQLGKASTPMVTSSATPYSNIRKLLVSVRKQGSGSRKTARATSSA